MFLKVIILDMILYQILLYDKVKSLDVVLFILFPTLFANNSSLVISSVKDDVERDSFLLLICPSRIIVVGRRNIFLSFLLSISSFTKSCKVKMKGVASVFQLKLQSTVRYFFSPTTYNKNRTITENGTHWLLFICIIFIMNSKV